MLNATRRRASQDQIKNLSRHAVGSKRERKPQRAYAYYSTARNEKKGAYTMSTNEMTSKIRELKELKAMQDELNAEITAIEDEIKAYMLSSGQDEITVDVFKVRYKIVESQRLNTSAFKANFPDLYNQYTKTTTTRRFSVA